MNIVHYKGNKERIVDYNHSLLLPFFVLVFQSSFEIMFNNLYLVLAVVNAYNPDYTIVASLELPHSEVFVDHHVMITLITQINES